VKSAFIASIVLLAAFLAAAVLRSNYEFLFYACTLIVLIGILYLLDRRFDFSAAGLWGLDGWLLLHLVGGMGSLDGVRMYDVMLVSLIGPPYDILRYDQFVHLYCYIVMGMLVFEALVQLLDRAGPTALCLVTILAASGIGGLNEVVEFAAVVVVGTTGVGDYTNTALDLVFNLAGAVVGAAVGLWRRPN